MNIGIDIWTFVKWIVVFAFSLYLVFAFVIVRQVQLMTKTLEIGFETQMKMLAILHLLGAVAVLIMAIAIL